MTAGGGEGGARILWLAVDEARGHLMRARLMQELLAPDGITVEILTTGEGGARYLRALGSDAEVLPGGWQLAYDRHQNLDEAASQALNLRYLASVTRPWRDWQMVARKARGARLVVSDSFFLFLTGVTRFPVVQVYGWHNLAAVEGYEPPVLKTVVRAGLAATLARMHRSAYSHVLHGLDADALAPVPGRGVAENWHHLPPLCAAPVQSVQAVRAALAVPAGKRLAVIYLNPFFADDALAQALKGGLEDAGYHVHAVGEGCAALPGWQARDPQLAERVFAADLYLSAAGMASVAQAHYFDTAYVALLSAQPEQKKNLDLLPGYVPRHRVLPLADAFHRDRVAALARSLHDDGTPGKESLTIAQQDALRQRVLAVQERWRATFRRLVAAAPGGRPRE